MITDRVSNMNIPLITMNAGIVLVINATIARVAPRDKDPTSPINICAGWILNHRNARSAQAMMKQSVERMKSHWVYVMNPYAAYWKKRSHPARPSSQSVILTLFAADITIMTKIII
jgi:hypothetical protein